MSVGRAYVLLSQSRRWPSGYRRLLHLSPSIATMWPPHFEDPIWQQNALKELSGSQEFERLKTVPIKSAPFTASASIFYSPIVERFTRQLMRKGKREIYDRLMLDTMGEIKRIQLSRYYDAKSDTARTEIETCPTRIIEMAVENASPLMLIQSVRMGSVQYQVPTPITAERTPFEAIRWIIEIAYDRPNNRKLSFYKSLADIIVQTSMNVGPVIARKHEHHRICDQNRAYANYRRQP
ncbi:hypothetical protein TCAL_09514 [Tigriopus californicus]|uniref:Small ribosomal subunit protein uS7 domain-containing protein n=1 Tax=Tigriopus californicus TaxID=6832 RepID=A0A553PAR0_TIGCA|nr:small ribosomal subunit protein uS7m-like [Tigriopus californicus]TRY74772.1 hypothetical protein TCAL_09514 [Tigriopus californicus]|eukprot:TCALIF_09514-PA protein Name:"Similar to mRpS7 28S ribosomal protein S7, mitochondrial (Drosophila melanogaster)" AED:0.01 eAED:0.01 QI:0/-1/0/1/-1/1/1/0/236